MLIIFLIFLYFRVQSKSKYFNYGNFSLKCAQKNLLLCMILYTKANLSLLRFTGTGIFTLYYSIVQLSQVFTIMSRREVKPFFSLTSAT